MNRYYITQAQIDALANIAVDMPGRWAIPTSDVLREILKAVVEEPQKPVEAPKKKG